MKILTRITDWLAMPYSLILLIRDPHTSRRDKVKAALVLAAAAFYLLDPVDVIPDITPLLGWVDDLLIVPAMLSIGGKAVPAVDFKAIQQKARRTAHRFLLWGVLGISLLVIYSLTVFGVLIYLAIRVW